MGAASSPFMDMIRAAMEIRARREMQEDMLRQQAALQRELTEMQLKANEKLREAQTESAKAAAMVAKEQVRNLESATQGNNIKNILAAVGGGFSPVGDNSGQTSVPATINNEQDLLNVEAGQTPSSEQGQTLLGRGVASDDTPIVLNIDGKEFRATRRSIEAMWHFNEAAKIRQNEAALASAVRMFGGDPANAAHRKVFDVMSNVDKIAGTPGVQIPNVLSALSGALAELSNLPQDDPLVARSMRKAQSMFETMQKVWGAQVAQENQKNAQAAAKDRQETAVKALIGKMTEGLERVVLRSELLSKALDNLKTNEKEIRAWLENIVGKLDDSRWQLYQALARAELQRHLSTGSFATAVVTPQ